MRTIILADCHVGSRESNYKDVRSVLPSLRFDELVLAGDFWDLWDMSPKRLRSRHADALALLEQVRSMGVRITYVLGNHDEDYRRSPVMSADMADVVDGPYFLPGHGRRMAVIHGHEFDHVFQNHEWYYRFLSWVNRTGSMVGISAKTFKKRTCTDLDGDEYSKTVRSIHDRAMAAYAGRCDCLIMGHTHCPIHLVSCDGLEYVNAGDWKWSDTWVDVVDGTATLRVFERA